MLAGSQYDISVRQVFECEVKLRLQDSLPLVMNSSRYVLIEIKSFDISDIHLIKELDRGGLQYPHPDVVSIVM
ncbi:hypothetical protein PR048_018232 [Dryococelus australis]|uniref:Uncharacterized protein n=1 Tax=Dryococelus australis TaxID=614101 RepID=A0ABQ9HBQ0_9NEOP|nr:hypothetical protein PR048_018232 [Dryococelus australis]